MVGADLLYSSTAITVVLLLVSIPNIRLVYKARNSKITKMTSETAVGG